MEILLPAAIAAAAGPLLQAVPPPVIEHDTPVSTPSTEIANERVSRGGEAVSIRTARSRATMVAFGDSVPHAELVAKLVHRLLVWPDGVVNKEELPPLNVNDPVKALAALVPVVPGSPLAPASPFAPAAPPSPFWPF
jgi:hypothetical protein